MLGYSSNGYPWRGIPIDAAVTASLVLFTETVEEKEFVELEMKYRCKLFLRDKEKMVKHILNLRNAATEGKMRGLSSLDDANADAVIQHPLPKRPKKQLVILLKFAQTHNFFHFASKSSFGHLARPNPRERINNLLDDFRNVTVTRT